MDLSQWGEAQNWESRVQLEDYWIIPGERWERPELRKWLWALFVIVKTEKPPTCPSTEEWIKKMWYIQWNTTCHKKEWKTAVWSNINGARYYTKWNKSGRKRQISYNTTHMWNLIFKKWCKRTYLWNWNRLTYTVNNLMVNKGEMWGRGINQELGIIIHTLLYVR